MLFPNVPAFRLTADQAQRTNDAQLALKLGKTIAEVEAMPATHYADLMQVIAFNEFMEARKERDHWQLLRRMFGRRR